MDPQKKKIINELKNRLSDHLGDDLKELILFGSQLSDKSNQDSDFDIMIIIKRNRDWKIEREISDICYDIDLKFGIITDTHIFSEDEMHSPRVNQPVFFNAIHRGYHAR